MVAQADLGRVRGNVDRGKGRGSAGVLIAGCAGKRFLAFFLDGGVFWHECPLNSGCDAPGNMEMTWKNGKEMLAPAERPGEKCVRGIVRAGENDSAEALEA